MAFSHGSKKSRESEVRLEAGEYINNMKKFITKSSDKQLKYLSSVLSKTNNKSKAFTKDFLRKAQNVPVDELLKIIESAKNPAKNTMQTLLKTVQDKSHNGLGQVSVGFKKMFEKREESKNDATKRLKVVLEKDRQSIIALENLEEVKQ
tara:strand:+ start:104 stop:550 length:447 start_codon:yes stop_codon:yes gene_type:complete